MAARRRPGWRCKLCPAYGVGGTKESRTLEFREHIATAHPTVPLFPYRNTDPASDTSPKAGQP